MAANQRFGSIATNLRYSRHVALPLKTTLIGPKPHRTRCQYSQREGGAARVLRAAYATRADAEGRASGSASQITRLRPLRLAA